MPRFILVDQSIERPGGHHYEYAVHIARAAVERGLDVVVATHERFNASMWPQDAGHVVPLFPYTTYCEHTFEAVMARGSATPPGGATYLGRLRRAFGNWTAGRREADRIRRIRGFAQACHTLLASQPLTSQDHVFCATMSDFDLEGLVTCLEAQGGAALEAHWHLQFHFDVLDGRASDYAEQRARLEQIRQRFTALLSRVPRQRLHFYCTTQEIAAQYNEMHVAPFRALPYAVNPALSRDEAEPADVQGTVRVTCAGHARREKGRRQFKLLIRDLWPDCLATGRVQLRIQGSPRKLRRWLPNSVRQVPDAVGFVPHPLPVEQYLELIRSSHVGLFLYDSERYRHRCSGILVEMLMAGVPVVVPAGCWLGEQIAEPIQQHLAGLVRRLPTVEGPLPLDWRPAAETSARFHPTQGLTVGGRTQSASAEFHLPERVGITDLLVECKWHKSTRDGSYLRLELEQYAADGRRLSCQAQLVGRRPELADPIRSHFRVEAEACRCEVRVFNAYRDHIIGTDAWHVRAVNAAGHPEGGLPAGQVGLQVADLTEYAAALRDVVQHYAHYRRSAAEFATAWRKLHDPRYTLATLLEAPEKPAQAGAA